MNEIKTLKAETLEPADREIFLQAIHDLRSPMSVLKILLARLERSGEVDTPALLSAVFERIESISETMLKSGRSERRKFSIPQAVHAVLAEKTVEYANGILFTSNISPEAVGLDIDTRELMRMLSNLINNAAQAGAAFIQVEVQRCGDAIHIGVSDDGRGFSEETIADLESGIAHLVAKPGHGFGLRRAQRLAAAMNGHLYLRSLPKQGSSVTLCVPVHNEEEV